RVLYDSVVRELSAHCARGDDRDLALEVNERFDDSLLTLERFDRARRVFMRSDERLPLAVVAEPGGLQDGGAAQLFERRIQSFERSDVTEGRDGKSVSR